MTRTHWLLCSLCPDLRVETEFGVKLLKAVGEDCLRIAFDDGSTGDDYSYSFNGCRPILRSLSTMTEEEKLEFAETHGYVRTGDFDKLQIIMDVDRPLVEINPPEGDPDYWTCQLNLDEFVWLLERGFYVGQCPEGEAVIE